MIRRIMAVLGLLAFTVGVCGGVWAGNSIECTLSRALGGMVAFCLLGGVLGWFAQLVVREYRQQQNEEVFGKGSAGAASEPGNISTSAETQPIQS